MSEGIVVVPYDDAWPVIFAAIGTRLRRELGDTALRVDHIGSTAVPGLDAKPIIDIQISVASFEPLDAFRVPIERAGLGTPSVGLLTARRSPYRVAGTYRGPCGVSASAPRWVHGAEAESRPT